jgi:hypothetical protein
VARKCSRQRRRRISFVTHGARGVHVWGWILGRADAPAFFHDCGGDEQHYCGGDLHRRGEAARLEPRVLDRFSMIGQPRPRLPAPQARISLRKAASMRCNSAIFSSTMRSLRSPSVRVSAQCSPTARSSSSFTSSKEKPKPWARLMNRRRRAVPLLARGDQRIHAARRGAQPIGRGRQNHLHLLRARHHSVGQTRQLCRFERRRNDAHEDARARARATDPGQ